MRPLLTLLLAAAVAAGNAPGAAADDRPDGGSGERGGGRRAPALDPGESDAPPLREMWVQPPRAIRALEHGLAFLASQQALTQDGSFPPSGYRDERYAPIGVTALAALAFLAAGHAPDRGPYGAEVARAIDYLLAHVDRDATAGGIPNPEYGYVHREGDTVSQIHGHGFATLALAQAYSTSPRSLRGERLAEALVLAVRCIERSQGGEGGWWYDPVVSASHEGSTTICLVQALRAARNAGIAVDRTVIERAEDYVRALQATEGENAGRFAYATDKRRYSLALTAAGVATLNAAGRYGGAEIESAILAIRKDLQDREDGIVVGAPDFPYYERLYVYQALWQLADTSLFERWFPLERESVLEAQAEDGSWRSLAYGDSYATAVNCLFLALPEALLPIFQR